jgi:hypothetical protein
MKFRKNFLERRSTNDDGTDFQRDEDGKSFDLDIKKALKELYV